MSSQESSSVRIYSGVAFAAMGGDSISREVSMPSAFSTESSLEVASCPTDKGVTGSAREAASTLGRFSEKEEDDVVVSYEDLQSALTVEDFV